LTSWKILLRWLLASLLYYSGALRLYCRLGQRQRPVILTYHRVLNPAEEPGYIQPGMYVRPQTFEKHLRYLTRCYRVVTMEQLMVWRGQPTYTQRPLCVITFDDGWEDNYSQALPLLRRYHCPATLFVATDFIGSGQTPWFYRLGGLLHALAVVPNSHHGVALTPKSQVPAVLLQWLGTSTTVRRQQVDIVIEALKELPVADAERIIAQLQHLLQQTHQAIQDNQGVMLDWQQVREMQTHGIEIGSHSLSHAILTQVTQTASEREVVESKSRLETKLCQEVKGFCYPNGNYNDGIESSVKAAGYTYACTTRSGCVTPHENPYRLKRISVHQDITFSTALFACHIAGIFHHRWAVSE
jgi:peptidoglycan/xylan/chitin deacetylase (PgdA/CDA1 family)